MIKKLLLMSCIATLAVIVACNRSQTNPSAPSMAAGEDAGAAADGSTLKIGAPTLVSPINGLQLQAADAVILTLTNVSGTYTTIAVTYEVELKNAAGALVANPKFSKAGGSTTSVTITTTLATDAVFTWRVRATSNGRVGPWSGTGTFRTAVPAPTEGIFGQVVIDPLTNGKTYGKQRGGRFISGQGWQSESLFDGIDYDIPTCASCKVEFDVTNVANGIGNPGDLKWLSMGDATTFGDFLGFRDGLWKMTLEQRGDGDGTGMKLVWRNGVAGDGDPGDHVVTIANGGPSWNRSRVFHFVVQWTPSSLLITIDGQVWFSRSFAAPYAPPNHRISLGCYPRGETLVGPIWRNVTVKPN